MHFGEIRTYKFVDFTLQLKIGLGIVGITYLVCGILENSMTWLYGKKAVDLFETNPITVIAVIFLLLSKDEKL